MLQLIVKSRQLTDVQPCPNAHANMTSEAAPRSESRSVIHRDCKTLLRSSANNVLTRPTYDVPRANFANNHCTAVLRDSLLPVAADLVLVDRENRLLRASIVSSKKPACFTAAASGSPPAKAGASSSPWSHMSIGTSISPTSTLPRPSITSALCSMAAHVMSSPGICASP
jgi:hypothetical protein